MQEREVRLLFEKGYITGAKVISGQEPGAYNVLLIHNEGKEEPAVLSAKRGGARIFKTSDAVLSWCQEIGFDSVKVQFKEPEPVLEIDQLNTSLDILLVEDNEDDIILTLRALKSHRIRNNIVIKRDGQEALNYLFNVSAEEKGDRSHLPGLVLLDLKLPKVSGLEVLKKIRHNKSTRLIPVVILTTSDEHCDVYQGYDLGTNSYLRKPVEYHAFVKVVKEIGHYWLSSNIPPPTSCNKELSGPENNYR